MSAIVTAAAAAWEEVASYRRELNSLSGVASQCHGSRLAQLAAHHAYLDAFERAEQLQDLADDEVGRYNVWHHLNQ